MNNWRFKSTSAVTVIGVLLLALWWARPAVPKEGWTNLRVVQGVTPYKQNSIVLDDQIWMHARRDLGDLRMFTSGSGAAGTRESKSRMRWRLGAAALPPSAPKRNCWTWGA